MDPAVAVANVRSNLARAPTHPSKSEHSSVLPSESG